MPSSLPPRVRCHWMTFCLSKGHPTTSMGLAMSHMQSRRSTTTRRRRRLLKHKTNMKWPEYPAHKRRSLRPRRFLHQLTMTLQENITHLMCYAGITMGMFMPNMLALLMAILSGPFGSLRFLSLTPKDPSKNGYLNPRNDLL